MLTQILGDDEDDGLVVATGVEFIPPGPDRELRLMVLCTKEVILSAGPIKSPHILMLSGIGPVEHLRGHGVPAVRDLPVGYNLQDHVALPAFVFADRPDRPAADIAADSRRLADAEARLYDDGTSAVGLAQLTGFLKSRPELEYPDLQVVQFRVPLNSTGAQPNGGNLLSNLFGYAEPVTRVYDRLNERTDIVVMAPVMLQPGGAGRVALRSADPLDEPRIYADYLSRPADLEALLRGANYVLRLSDTEPMVAAGLQLQPLDLPGCGHLVWGTRDYWLCAVRTMAAPFYHASGTCKMGAADDRLSVVDPELRVKGVYGLRVVDSSVMPQIVSVNTNGASIMIGEKGSDLIKECYGKL